MDADIISEVSMHPNLSEIEESDTMSNSATDSPVTSSSESSVQSNKTNATSHSTITTEPNKNTLEYNRELQRRILALAETIASLKVELQEERENWKRELGDRNDLISNSPSAPVLIPTVVNYDYYDYEHDLQRYQDVLLQSHFESRQNLQKQIAFANYRRRLLEVESMCNLELLRVKQSVQILQPLQLMASEWKIDYDCGDFRQSSGMLNPTVEKPPISNEIKSPLENIVCVQNPSGDGSVTLNGEPELKVDVLDADKQSQSEQNFQKKEDVLCK